LGKQFQSGWIACCILEQVTQGDSSCLNCHGAEPLNVVKPTLPQRRDERDTFFGE
jgi:hypothetical protein